ncbi:hypothetical protein Y032_0054g2454 [Ancylostoma ceylanicum]|uniref:Glucuronosyltransferase n=1 Tax=Ancylostoma ceylanicum TaxID=53326 RepID=A0A016U6Z8_9BILA|nr:hypothetical protein Y032_0054g2454 [Ancylostoma ceylanicum]
MRCLALIFLFVKFVQPLSIVVYLSLVGKSHVDFVSALINILVERGHEVVSSLFYNMCIEGSYVPRAAHITYPG